MVLGSQSKITYLLSTLSLSILASIRLRLPKQFIRPISIIRIGTVSRVPVETSLPKRVLPRCLDILFRERTEATSKYSTLTEGIRPCIKQSAEVVSIDPTTLWLTEQGYHEVLIAYSILKATNQTKYLFLYNKIRVCLCVSFEDTCVSIRSRSSPSHQVHHISPC